MMKNHAELGQTFRFVHAEKSRGEPLTINIYSNLFLTGIAG